MFVHFTCFCLTRHATLWWGCYGGSRHDAKYDQYSNLANLFYEGCLQTIDTTPDGFSPVETTDTKQTRLVVQEPGKSRLKTER